VLTLALCQLSTAKCLNETRIEDTKATIRVGPFATDASYFQFHVAFAGINVSLSVVGGDGRLSVLADPVGCESTNCSDYALVLLPRFQWYREGTINVSASDGTIAFSPLGFPTSFLRPTRPPMAALSHSVTKALGGVAAVGTTSVLRAALSLGGGPVGIREGGRDVKPPTVEEVTATVASARRAELARYRAYGALAEVKEALAADGVNVNERAHPGLSTPVFIASWKGHTEVVKLLLQTGGIDVNQARTTDGVTPLLIASQKGHTEVVKLLLETGETGGIDVNQAITTSGATPFFLASELGHTEIVKLLLQTGGIDVNQATTDRGYTPLLVASWKGHTEVVKLLLQTKGIDVNQTGKQGAFPLFQASWAGHTETVRALLSAPGIDTEKKWKAPRGDEYYPGQYTPLSTAEKEGHSEIVALLRATPLELFWISGLGSTLGFWGYSS